MTIDPRYGAESLGVLFPVPTEMIEVLEDLKVRLRKLCVDNQPCCVPTGTKHKLHKLVQEARLVQIRKFGVGQYHKFRL